MGAVHGSVIPIANTATRHRYSPSVVSSTNSPVASSRRVRSHVQPYRTRTPPTSANPARPRSISGRLGKYEVPSMSAGITARCAGSSPRSEFQSYRSYSRDPSSTGAYGLVHVMSRWNKIGEHTSELQSRRDLVCRLLLEKKKKKQSYKSMKKKKKKNG